MTTTAAQDKSWMEEEEELVDIASKRAINIILEMYAKLTPDGRPFGVPNLPPEQQLAQYLELKEQGAQGFLQYMLGKVTDLMNQLSGIPPEAIASISPVNIVVLRTYEWASEMENLLRKQETKLGSIFAGEQAEGSAAEAGELRGEPTGSVEQNPGGMESGTET